MPTVLLVSGDSSRTGVPHQVALLALNLKKTSWQPEVACPDGWLAAHLSARGVLVHKLPLSRRASIRELKGINADLVHSHGVRAGLIARIALPATAHRPHIYTEHLWTNDFHLSNPLRSRAQVAMLRLLEQRTTTSIAVSQAVADFQTDKLGLSQTTIIPGAIEGLAVTPLPKSVGLLGSLLPAKRVAAFLHACALLPKRVPVHVMGSGPLESELRALAATLRLQVTWHATDTRLQEFFDQVGVYVQPSSSESFGLAVLNALSAGRPVVTSNRGALPELIHSPELGAVTDGHPQSLAKAMQHYLREPGDSHVRHEEAMRYSPARMTKAYLELYAASVGNPLG